jgi:2-polyprenyl-3-methyl-5-hydroxy-6-metoxy-1,4-benzoquinol methylase
MIEKMAKNLVNLKNEFSRVYEGNSHIQEVIPISKSDAFPLDDIHIEKLHQFAEKNPIYYNSFEINIGKIPCRVYEGDINEYWLNSITNGASYQPFYPTWILTAYIISLMAQSLEYKEILDIGSGDGRIAYCAKLLDLETYSIEVDESLIELQKLISISTKIDFNPKCADAVEFDYSNLKLKHPIFFIGGLAQMGGDILATSIIEKLNTIPNLKKNIGMTFAGTYSKKYLLGAPSESMPEGGWKSIIDKNDMKVIKTIILPTVWTFDQPIDTPYIFTKFN